jgi:long-chain acyl-CoA synthetase
MEQLEAKTGATIVEGYGMSETSNILTINPMHVRKPGSVGVAVPDTDLVVVDAVDGKTPCLWARPANSSAAARRS